MEFMTEALTDWTILAGVALFGALVLGQFIKR